MLLDQALAGHGTVPHRSPKQQLCPGLLWLLVPNSCLAVGSPRPLCWEEKKHSCSYLRKMSNLHYSLHSSGHTQEKNLLENQQRNKKKTLTVTYCTASPQLQYNLILSLKYFAYSTLHFPTNLVKHNKCLASSGAYVGNKEYWNMLFLIKAREGVVTSEVLKWHLHFSDKQA